MGTSGFVQITEITHYYWRASHELFLKKGVPHQFSSDWEIFQNDQLAGKMWGTSQLKNQNLLHKIWNTTLFGWKITFTQQPNNKVTT